MTSPEEAHDVIFFIGIGGGIIIGWLLCEVWKLDVRFRERKKEQERNELVDDIVEKVCRRIEA